MESVTYDDGSTSSRIVELNQGEIIGFTKVIVKTEESNRRFKMTHGRIDTAMVSDKFEYMIVYSEPDEPNEVNTWVLPEGSFQMTYKSMVKRGYIIHNIFKRLTEEDLLQTMLR